MWRGIVEASLQLLGRKLHEICVMGAYQNWSSPRNPGRCRTLYPAVGCRWSANLPTSNSFLLFRFSKFWLLRLYRTDVPGCRHTGLALCTRSSCSLSSLLLFLYNDGSLCGRNGDSCSILSYRGCYWFAYAALICNPCIDFS